MKKLISIVVCISVLCSVFMLPSLSVNAVEIEGFTAISTKEDFYNIRNNPNGKYYLTEDLAFSPSDFTAMGDYYGGFSTFNTFSGTLDGCGHIISGLESTYGIAATNNGTVKNLEFSDCDFTKAGFVNNNYGNIINCKVTNSVIGDGSSTYNAAGIALVNQSSGKIEYTSVDDCVINGRAGIAVQNAGTISYCVNYTNISHSNSNNTAGIAAVNTGKINDCINYGEIDMERAHASGICASNSKVIENCANYGTILAKGSVKYATGIAIAGSNYRGEGCYINNCLNAGQITSISTGKACGISNFYAGQNINCINTGMVNNGSGYAITEKSADVANCYFLSATGISPGESFSKSQLVENTFSGFDFEDVWQLENGVLSLRAEKEFETGITGYQHSVKTVYLRGSQLELSDMKVLSLNSLGTWKELSANEYVVNGYDKNKLGKQKVDIVSGENKFSFNVYVKGEIAKQSIELNQDEFSYFGGECKPAVTIRDEITNSKLIESRDYSVSYENNINAGKAKVIIEGLGNYEGVVVKEFDILPVDINEISYYGTSPFASYDYSGMTYTPDVILKNDYGTKLTKNTDYTLTYSDNKNAGTGYIYVKGKGNYCGDRTIEFEISPMDISYCTVSLSCLEYTYDGTAKTPTVIVEDRFGILLNENVDYEVVYDSECINVGTKYVYVKGIGNYSGESIIEYEISPIYISYCTVSLSCLEYTYDGTVKTPTVIVKDCFGILLNENVDYEVVYDSDRINAGAKYVYVKGIGNYSGESIIEYEISPIDISYCTVSLSCSEYTYDGTVKTPTVTVADSFGMPLIKNVDYKVNYDSGRINSGSYKVTINMIGNYSGTKTLYFNIKPINALRCSVNISNATYTYSGRAVTPAVIVKDINGRVIGNSNYIAQYASGRKECGTYAITVTFKGNYSGKKMVYFQIIPKRAKVSKLTAAKKSLKVKIKREKSVSGYQIQYSLKKNFKSAKSVTLKKNSLTSKTIKKLKSKKTYYVRVRSYKTVNGKKYYSAWSSAKKKKTK